MRLLHHNKVSVGTEAWLHHTHQHHHHYQQQHFQSSRRSTSLLVPLPWSSSSFWTVLRSASTTSSSRSETVAPKEEQEQENDNTDVTTSSVVWDRETLLHYAQEQQGVVLSLSTLGPGYRAVARCAENRSEILGYVEGIVRGKLLHLDKTQIFASIVQRVRQSSNNPKFTGGGNVFGVGLLLAYLCVLHGQEQGCSTAEFLAIDDSDVQHERLVKLYRQAGFKYIKYVGDDWKDIPDRMVWGGCGTLLRQDVPYLLSFWTRLLEKGRQRKLQQQQQRLEQQQ